VARGEHTDRERAASAVHDTGGQGGSTMANTQREEPDRTRDSVEQLEDAEM
jgi:hypothetical protein